MAILGIITGCREANARRGNVLAMVMAGPYVWPRGRRPCSQCASTANMASSAIMLLCNMARRSSSNRRGGGGEAVILRRWLVRQPAACKGA